MISHPTLSDNKGHADKYFIWNEARYAQWTPREQIYISEVCVLPPKTKKNWPAWIEIWNNSKQAVDLSGYTISTLQAQIRPFDKKLVLGSGQHCLVLCYTGKKVSEEFEESLPAGVKIARHFDVDVFPLVSKEKWYSALPAEVLDLAQVDYRDNPDEKERNLNAHIAAIYGCSRFVNEVALWSGNQEVVAYAAWGDQRLFCSYLKTAYIPTEARKNALHKGLFDEANAVHPIGFLNPDVLAVQLYLPGEYKEMRSPLLHWSPGRPMDIKARPPIVNSIKPCIFEITHGGRYGHVIAKLSCNLENQPIDFERLFGWSGIEFDLCYDLKMTKPVFEEPLKNQHPPRQWGYLHFAPLDFFCLAGRTLYARAKKVHANKPPLYSEVKEVTLCLDDGIRRRRNFDSNSYFTAPLVASESVAQVNLEEFHVDPVKIAKYVKQCNRLLLEFFPQQNVSPRFDVLGGIDEVTVDFGRKPSTLIDISDLAGLPVRRLDIANSSVADIGCVKQMPLTHLNLANTAVTDLTALAGQTLQKLILTGTSIAPSELAICQKIGELEWLDCAPDLLAQLIRLDNVGVVNGMPRDSLLEREQKRGLDMNLTVRVREHLGHSLPNTAVQCTIVPFKSPSAHSEPNKSHGVTDAEGLWTTPRLPTTGTASLHTHKNGYYSSSINTQPFGDGSQPLVKDGQWSPWNVTMDVVCKPVVNPVPMRIVDWGNVKVPRSGRHAYDLVKGDWVTPIGNGTTADVFVTVRQAPEPGYGWEVIFELPGEQAGIQVCKGTPWSGLASAYQAPIDGYQKQFRFANLHPVEKPADVAGLQEDDYLVFRIRPKLDERGKLVEAMYGKTSGPPNGWNWIPQTWYLNPDGTRNLEHEQP